MRFASTWLLPPAAERVVWARDVPGHSSSRSQTRERAHILPPGMVLCVKVVLPDATELELPDGASGLDAARAIGPKLAEQAVLVRANGETRDLRLPLADGERIQILTTRDTDDPGRARRAAALDGASARRGRDAAAPRREDRDRASDRRRLLLRLRVPGAHRGGRPGRDRGRDPAGDRRRPRVDARGALPGGRGSSLRGGAPAVQGRARRDG